MEKYGLVIVHTGNGKGKTTAALGQAVRAWGDGLRVCILQFIKGGWKYGELKTLETLAAADGRIEIKQCGLGFTNTEEHEEQEHKEAASKALAMAREAITSGDWDLVILDEINYAVKFGLITVDDVLALLACRPKDLHLVLTGRDAKPELIEKADLVTEMKQIKHPYEQGIKAQMGIEF
ncbi:cob(I)alamin adenosyltransferase [Selenomonas sp. WCT3]|uniref:cob(I)yrinic acid a,c-diamide adenosyltransferase n=1 Tax=Selenomonas sp. WCT3 TaxID=3158785 RepID=UPI0008856CF8|nr:cob(I)alamin adenosyltransferase [Selenomonas ruminantium]